MSSSWILHMAKSHPTAAAGISEAGWETLEQSRGGLRLDEGEGIIPNYLLGFLNQYRILDTRMFGLGHGFFWVKVIISCWKEVVRITVRLDISIVRLGFCCLGVMAMG